MKMPVLFLGHGSPMNAIEDNEFSRGFRNIAKSLPRPDSIVCISAHWETFGTMLTAMNSPKTIHDFGGFPKALYEIEYPAPGNPALANEIIEHNTLIQIQPDMQWGLDHGTWSVLRHMYPDADIPIIQLSIDRNANLMQQVEIAKSLQWLRDKGVMLVGSGNIVHNLGHIDWEYPDAGFPWAIQAGNTLRQWMADNNFSALMDYQNQGEELRLAIPTPEHFIPALYILAQKQREDTITFFNQKTVLGAIDMTSFVIR